jgi:hypothetical protein
VYNHNSEDVHNKKQLFLAMISDTIYVETGSLGYSVNTYIFYLQVSFSEEQYSKLLRDKLATTEENSV